MAASVYIETTVPGAYFDDRDNVVSQYQRYQTRIWWSQYRAGYDLYTSQAVLAELSRLAAPYREETTSLLDKIPVLPVTDEITGVARVYVEHLVMPRGRMGDSFHLALACVNIQHMLNPECVVFGGGLIGAGDQLLTPIRAHFERQVWKVAEDFPRIELATLGDDAGVIGAATLARLER